jgi:hypothetical protein
MCATPLIFPAKLPAIRRILQQVNLPERLKLLPNQADR